LLIFPHIWGLMAVWVGLTLFMSLRLTVGIWRVGTAAGPWEFLRDNTEFDEPAA
jgi:Na+-driven multidrug efflux pump